jgi:hypothetical protein
MSPLYTDQRLRKKHIDDDNDTAKKYTSPIVNYKFF